MTSRLDHLHEQDHFASELAVPIHAELTDLWDKSLIAIRQWELSVPSLTT
jgi:hypothetical protein